MSVRRVALLASVVALLSLAAFPGLAQDPVKVSPEHYKVEIDNEQVRVLRATRGPHEKGPMHSHPEYVAVYLKPLHQKITLADGTVQEPNRKAGEVSFSKPVTHEEENLADQPLEVMVVELKAKASPAKSAPVTLDPLKLLPNQVQLEFENDRVRVLRAKRGPHQKFPMHEHPAYVAVFLTDVHQNTTEADGSVHEITRKAGEVSFSKPIKHAEENLSDQPFEAVLIELK